MTTGPQIVGIAPVLLVADVARAATYYVDALGFRSPRMWGDPPAFCIAMRDGHSVMLNQVGPSDNFEPNAAYDGRFSAYFDVHDADALFAEFKANGAKIVCEPEDQAFGMREFQVRDPDGHLLGFGQNISETASHG